MEFTRYLLHWYNQHKRDLPWRQTKDPYFIWLSEIILQQTRIDQGLPYYLQFIHTFPSVDKLADASEEDVLKLWQGLGYYSRARNLHATAREIVMKYHGNFPDSYDKILTLKGIGTYTASAIASIAFNLPYPVVDGNVIRFLSRYFGIREQMDTEKAKWEISEYALKLLDKTDPGTFNQAMMEFGALYCTPRSPDCDHCVFSPDCFAFLNHMVDRFPFKGKKAKQKKRYFNYLVVSIKGDNGFYLTKREKTDIWKNLYTFPMIETLKNSTFKNLMNTMEWTDLFNSRRIILKNKSDEIQHILTHQLIIARFFELETDSPLTGNVIYLQSHEIEKYPIPRLMEKYFSKHGRILNR